MAKKLKGYTQPVSELHFITNVSLEQAVMLLGDLADDTYAVTLTEVSSDIFEFEIDDTRSHSHESKINGTLQRWQGTDTRVDATGEVFRESDWFPSAQYVFIGIGAILLLGIGIHLMAYRSNLLYVLFGLGLLATGSVMFWYLYEEIQKETSKVLPVHFRARDQLLQQVIDTFKSVGTVEAYEPDTYPNSIPLLSNSQKVGDQSDYTGNQ